MASFEKIREAAPLNEVARNYLKLKLVGDEDGVLRTHCPKCQPEPDEDERGVLTIQPTKADSTRRYFTCHNSKNAWGDSISLVAHCHNISVQQAGDDLAKVYLHFEEKASKPNPEPKPYTQAKQNGFDPLKYINTLNRDKEDVSEFGITAELCEESGMGLCTKGINRGKLTIPLRRDDGSIIGFIGVSGDVSAPKKWRVA